MQKTDNRTTGGRFEQELSHILAENGFWVHVMQQNKAGQPADLIAVKGRFHTLIDCKVCENGYFPFDRIEENQRSAMKMFFRKTGELCYFALKMPDGEIRMVNLARLETIQNRPLSSSSNAPMPTESAWMPATSWNMSSMSGMLMREFSSHILGIAISSISLLHFTLLMIPSAPCCQ